MFFIIHCVCAGVYKYPLVPLPGKAHIKMSWRASATVNSPPLDAHTQSPLDRSNPVNSLSLLIYTLCFQIYTEHSIAGLNHVAIYPLLIYFSNLFMLQPPPPNGCDACIVIIFLFCIFPSSPRFTSGHAGLDDRRHYRVHRRSGCGLHGNEVHHLRRERQTAQVPHRHDGRHHPTSRR